VKFRKHVQLVALTIVFALAWAITLVLFAYAGEQQIRVYDSQGNSVGTIVPQGDGSTVRYYDAHGNSRGTATTNSTGTTTFYGPGGSVTGRAVAPSSRPTQSHR
jgi:hypothetical protein